MICLSRLYAAITWCCCFIILVIGTAPKICTEPTFNANCRCDAIKPSNPNPELVIVSTLDGVIHALDINDNGRLAWSVAAGSDSLLQSTISTNDILPGGSEPFKLIPSLDGNLYLYHAEKGQIVPVSADQLLASSLVLAADVIAGGKQVTTMGLDFATGKVQYLCDFAGCNRYPDIGSGENRETAQLRKRLVIKRTTHNLRGLDPISGFEKWNVTVGEHELMFPESVTEDSGCCHCATQVDDLVEALHHEESTDNVHNTVHFRFLPSKGSVQAFVSDCLTSDKLLWEHVFERPVIQSWRVSENGALKELSLFEHSAADFSSAPLRMDDDTLLYLGKYKDQYYLVPSSEEKRKFNELRVLDVQDTGKFYLAAADDGQKDSVKFSEVEDQDGSCYPGCPTCSTDEFNALMLRNYDTQAAGWFLLKHRTTGPVQQLFTKAAHKSVPLITHVPSKHFGVKGSFWAFWKEVIGVALVCCLITALVVRKHLKQRYLQRINSEAANKSLRSRTRTTSVEVHNVDSQASFSCTDMENYESRFFSEFEPIRCLGAGGFGVVFEVKKCIDDCVYAVKRISVADRPAAREKVMREVKALAKLVHPGIVRYYHSWLECPPSGWQDKADKTILTNCTSERDVSSPSSQKTPFFKSSPVLDTPSLGFVSGNFAVVGSDNSCISRTDLEDTDKFSCSNFAADVVTSTPIKSRLFDVSDSNSSLPSSSVFSASKHTSPGESSLHSASGGSIRFAKSVGPDVVNYSSDNRSKQTELNNDSKFSRRDRECLKLKLNKKKDIKKLDQQLQTTPIPKVYLYIQMQLCQDETLRHWLEKNSDRDRMKMLAWFDQLVSAVKYIHKEGLIHRDLKPSNIFFSLSGQIVIGDFGLVKDIVQELDDSPFTNSPEVAKQHTECVGTALYMSPEQALGNSYTHKVDIYSLGLILFELFCPFSTAMERIMVLQNLKRLTFPPAFLVSFAEECSLISSMIAEKAQERPNCDEIHEKAIFVPLRVPSIAASIAAYMPKQTNEKL